MYRNKMQRTEIISILDNKVSVKQVSELSSQEILSQANKGIRENITNFQIITLFRKFSVNKCYQKQK
jgi:hypothetical protein